MKILGISGGRKMGNSEIVLKEALMGAQEVGADVDFIRMLDMDIRPCKFCDPCPVGIKGWEGCIHKDDAGFFMENFLECDGLIFSLPLYSLSVPGQILVIRDRLLGPKVDVTILKQRGTPPQAPPESQERDAGYRGAFPEGEREIDQRHFKNRTAGFICMGGAPDMDWTTLGLPVFHTLTFSAQIAVVDQMQVIRSAAKGAVVLKDKDIARAHELGMHVAFETGKAYDDTKYYGEETWTCPSCHNNLFVINRDTPVMCAICGVKGEIIKENGKTTIQFPDEELQRSHLTIRGREIHGSEIMDIAKDFMQRKDQVPPKLDKYKKFKGPLKPWRHNSQK